LVLVVTVAAVPWLIWTFVLLPIGLVARWLVRAVFTPF
jgi:hypothetical protein